MADNNGPVLVGCGPQSCRSHEGNFVKICRITPAAAAKMEAINQMCFGE